MNERKTIENENHKSTQSREYSTAFSGNNGNGDDGGDGGLQIVFCHRIAQRTKTDRADMVLAYSMHFVRLDRMQCKMDEEAKTKRKNEMLKENGAQTKPKDCVRRYEQCFIYIYAVEPNQSKPNE